MKNNNIKSKEEIIKKLIPTPYDEWSTDIFNKEFPTDTPKWYENNFYVCLRGEYFDASEHILRSLNTVSQLDYYNTIICIFFTDLCLGIERMEKLLLLMLGNGELPRTHNLSELWDNLVKLKLLEPLEEGSIEKELLQFLSDFQGKPNQGRYLRLQFMADCIEKEKQLPFDEPPERIFYYKVIDRILDEDMKGIKDTEDYKKYAQEELGTKTQKDVSSFLRQYIGRIIRPIYNIFYEKFIPNYGMSEYLEKAVHISKLRSEDEGYRKKVEWELINQKQKLREYIGYYIIE